MGGPDNAAEQWIVITKWEEFQHRDAFRSRTPTWIKVFTELHHKDEWLDLTGHQRGVLLGLWLEYVLARGQLRLDTVSLSRRLNLRVTARILERLNHAGWIEFHASRPASISASKDASPDVKGRDRSKTPDAVTSTVDAQPSPNGTASHVDDLDFTNLLRTIPE